LIYDEKIKQAAELVKQANYIVVFTGAGISVESGIPDFRSPGGLWERYNPNEYATYSAFLKHPEKYWTMHKELRDLVLTAQPNPAHKALAALEHEFGKLRAVITQNVDFLHSRAGNTKVLEIHGSIQTYRCLSCKMEFKFSEIDTFLTHSDLPPRCPKCNGLIKPNTILFGESLSSNVLKDARDEIIKADLLIVIGSSLVVYPAASLPSIAVETGAKLLIVNFEPTNMDSYADVVIHAKAGELIPKILSGLKEIS
jgi:NAD-dependent deacetylase